MTPHGTESTYTNHGCRCDACRTANAAATRRGRERRAAALAAGQVTPPHGRYSTYTNYGCRCDECRAANAARSARYDQAIKT